MLGVGLGVVLGSGLGLVLGLGLGLGLPLLCESRALEVLDRADLPCHVHALGSGLGLG